MYAQLRKGTPSVAAPRMRGGRGSVRSDLYISGDIEADGPIPGVNSMLSLGFAVAGRFDGVEFAPHDPREEKFYRELKPISDVFAPDALRVSGLDRGKLSREGVAPETAMAEAASWVLRQAGADRAVLVGYPVVFDWQFLHWYFIRFAGASPFGFSGALDMKTMYHQKARVTLDAAGLNELPEELRSARRHTHNALDDAVEQAEIFNRLFTWKGDAT